MVLEKVSEFSEPLNNFLLLHLDPHKTVFFLVYRQGRHKLKTKKMTKSFPTDHEDNVADLFFAWFFFFFLIIVFVSFDINILLK